MQKLTAFLLFVAALVVLSGCGGGGGGFDRFVGQWTGIQQFYRTNNSLEYQGDLEFFVDEDGFIEGTIRRSDVPETATIRGTISGDDRISLTWFFTGFGSNRNAAGQVGIFGGVLRALGDNQGEQRLPATNSNGAIGSMYISLTKVAN